MKKYTEYKILTPYEVAEIGERDGWPIKGLAVSNDGVNWDGLRIVHAYLLGDATPVFADGSHRWKYCARPIERIEWEVGDTVQWAYIKGWVEKLLPTYVRIVNADPCANKHLIAKSEIQPWTPGYRYTVEGELIIPLTGYEIVLEGESLPYTGKLFQHGAWHEYKLDGSERNNFAQLKFDVRAYARKIEPVEQTAYNWFRQILPRKVANRIINKVTAHELNRKYKSAGNSLWNSFDWDETPERADYWIDWYEWLNGDMEEMPPNEPDPIAEGHNPAGLTVPQVGKGWRLLSKEEIAEREPTEKIQAWLRSRNSWSGLSIYRGSEATMTYRTQQPEGYFLPVADSLEEYYGAKQQPATITQEMIEKVLETLLDCEGDASAPDTDEYGWAFSSRPKSRAKQCKDFAAALNGQLSEKGEEPKSDNLRKLSEKWESELKRHKGKAKVYDKTSPYIANMWRETAGVIEDMLGELNDALNEDIEQKKGI